MGRIPLFILPLPFLLWNQLEVVVEFEPDGLLGEFVEGDAHLLQERSSRTSLPP